MTSATEKMIPVVPKQGRDGRIGRLLLDLGKITVDDAERILHLQRERQVRFGDAAKELGLVSDADIQTALASQFEYSYLTPGQGEYSEELAAAYRPFSPQVEILRAIRTQLMLRWFSSGRRGLVIAGLNAQDGASLLAANLSIVFSQLGERTLLVDANLRQPKQHDLFRLPAWPGLSDVLAGRAGAEATKSIGAIANLAILPAGSTPPNPQELLARATFNQLNQNFVANYDVILYDVPSIQSAADALEMAAHIGGVLLVARKHHTRLADVRAAKEQFERHGVQIVGSIVNEL